MVSSHTRHLQIGVVVTTHADGGGEAFLRSLYSALRREDVLGHLIGDVPGWESTGLGNTSVVLGRKWGKGHAVVAVSKLASDRRRLLEGVASAKAAVSGFDAHHLQYKREQVLTTSALADLAPVIWTEHGTFPRRGGLEALRLHTVMRLGVQT